MLRTLTKPLPVGEGKTGGSDRVSRVGSKKENQTPSLLDVSPGRRDTAILFHAFSVKTDKTNRGRPSPHPDPLPEGEERNRATPKEFTTLNIISAVILLTVTLALDTLASFLLALCVDRIVSA
jgi:hypothetical protein